METAFKMIDRVIKSLNYLQKNGSGGIAIDELKETFGTNIETDDCWKIVISEVDKN
jgi:hypothetical protein